MFVHRKKDLAPNYSFLVLLFSINLYVEKKLVNENDFLQLYQFLDLICNKILYL